MTTNPEPLTTNEHRWLMIKYRLGLRRRTFADIGRRLGFKRTDQVAAVARGEWKSQRIRKAIADEIDMDYVELWGEEPRGPGRPRPKRKNEDSGRDGAAVRLSKGHSRSRTIVEQGSYKCVQHAAQAAIEINPED